MGYACPVCEDPQADGEHLANHLAFTAMLGDDDHEAWLDEHAPDWADSNPEELAEQVTEHAEEEEFPQVFEDTTDQHAHDYEHRHGRGPEADALGGFGDVATEMPDADAVETDDVLAEARELTRRRRENAGGEGEASEGETSEE